MPRAPALAATASRLSSMQKQFPTCLIVVMMAIIVSAQEDPRLIVCRRDGWVFLPGVQQKSWQAIITSDCVAHRDPGLACAQDNTCIGFTSNGNQGNGWKYRLPNAKKCGPLRSLRDLDFEWDWSWVPMKCEDRGPCCGTYLANDNGAAAAFDLVCKESAGAGSSNTCPTWCPRMDRTHEYFNYQLFEIDCQDQKSAAGVKGRRRLHADPKAASTQRLYLATISKVETNAPNSQGYVRAAGSSQCEQVARTCPSLR